MTAPRPMINLSLRLDTTLKRWITRRAKQARVKPSTLARTLLQDAAAREGQAQEVAPMRTTDGTKARWGHRAFCDAGATAVSVGDDMAILPKFLREYQHTLLPLHPERLVRRGTTPPLDPHGCALVRGPASPIKALLVALGAWAIQHDEWPMVAAITTLVRRHYASL